MIAIYALDPATFVPRYRQRTHVIPIGGSKKSTFANENNGLPGEIMQPRAFKRVVAEPRRAVMSLATVGGRGGGSANGAGESGGEGYRSGHMPRGCAPRRFVAVSAHLFAETATNQRHPTAYQSCRPCVESDVQADGGRPIPNGSSLASARGKKEALLCNDRWQLGELQLGCERLATRAATNRDTKFASR